MTLFNHYLDLFYKKDVRKLTNLPLQFNDWFKE